MRKAAILCSLMLLILASTAYSQNGEISGKVTEDTDAELPFAAVILHSAADSTMANSTITSETGDFVLTNVPAGEYFLEVTMVGFAANRTEVFTLAAGEKKQMPATVMASKAAELAEFAVVEERALIEVQPDKTVFNVDKTINATGSNGMELLRKAPGVMVDNNDNIKLAGKEGVQIWIDGKPSMIEGVDLVNFLKTLNSNEIDAIEIITNPSSKYDAEGNAGIINIKLKRAAGTGTNASLTIGSSYGKNLRSNAGVSLTHRGKKVNAYASYNHNLSDYETYQNISRQQSGNTYETRAINGDTDNSGSMRAGLDYKLNKKSTIGFNVRGGAGNGKWYNTSKTLGTPDTLTSPNFVLAATNDIDGESQNLYANTNYRFDNGSGATWSVDLDYGYYSREALSFQPNYYLSVNEQDTLLVNTYTNSSPTQVDFYTAQIDREQPFANGVLSIGAKAAYVETDNSYLFYQLIGNEEVLDIYRSNDFQYTENVNAGYINYKRSGDKWSWQLGLRVEQTNSIGDLTSQIEINDEKVERTYLDWFPSGGVSYNMNEKNMFQLTASRRIDRPNYQSLNPFEFKLDELAFEKGNPFLNPQYTTSVGLTHTYKYTLTTSLQYSHVNDFFTDVFDTLNQSASFKTVGNYTKQDIVTLDVSYPFALAKWWTVYLKTTGTYQHSILDFKDDVSEHSVVTGFVFMQNQFQINKKLTAEVSGWYSSPSIWNGYSRIESIGSVDLGLQARILKNRGTLRLNFNDIFLTNKWRLNSDLQHLALWGNGGQESRRVGLTFTYLFGNDQVKQLRERVTGSKEATDRI